MAHRIRTLALGLAVCATLVVNAPLCRADTEESTEADAMPIALDIPLRLLGIGLTAGGFLAFCAYAPIIAITRPTDGFGKAWNSFVVWPAKFTWVDPAGRHPTYPDAAFGDTTPKASPGGAH
jgi:hypothetical protein